jgi:hypothetical protein
MNIVMAATKITLNRTGSHDHERLTISNTGDGVTGVLVTTIVTRPVRIPASTDNHDDTGVVGRTARNPAIAPKVASAAIGSDTMVPAMTAAIRFSGADTIAARNAGRYQTAKTPTANLMSACVNQPHSALAAAPGLEPADASTGAVVADHTVERY